MENGERLEWLRCRWEFMRRDPRYLEAFQKHRELLALFKREEITLKQVFEESEAAARNFGLKTMFEPWKSFDEVLNVDDGEYPGLWGSALCLAKAENLFGQSKGFFYTTARPGALFPFTKIERHLAYYSTYLQIEIDFDHVNSIVDLKKMVLAKIDERWEICKQGEGRQKTIRKTDYDLILRIGDLKAEGKTNQEIAKMVFPDDFNDENEQANPESATRKVSLYFDRYKALVNGGYRCMTFP